MDTVSHRAGRRIGIDHGSGCGQPLTTPRIAPDARPAGIFGWGRADASLRPICAELRMRVAGGV